MIAYIYTYMNGDLCLVGEGGACWSASIDNYTSFYMRLGKGSVAPSASYYRANSHSVRCLKE